MTGKGACGCFVLIKDKKKADRGAIHEGEDDEDDEDLEEEEEKERKLIFN